MNMTPNEIMDGLVKKNRVLTIKNEELLELTRKLAEAERDYNVAVARKTISLKVEGHPVTLIPKLVAGDDTVADLKYKYDIADGVLKACRESMKDVRTAIDCYRSLLSWLKEELHNA